MKLSLETDSKQSDEELSGDFMKIFSDPENQSKIPPFMKLFWPKGKGQLFILKIGKRNPLKR